METNITVSIEEEQMLARLIRKVYVLLPVIPTDYVCIIMKSYFSNPSKTQYSGTKYRITQYAKDAANLAISFSSFLHRTRLSLLPMYFLNPAVTFSSL